jgi:hypothetical protein
MPKRSLFLLVALALILSACGGQAAASPTAVATEAPTSAATQAPAEAATSSATAEPVADCTVTTFIPEPDPTEASLFPAPGKDDWVMGSQTAEVTFMEYSDYQ